MAGVRARVVGGAILSALALIAPQRVVGAEETAQVLPGNASATLVADIDGDGARDLVRIVTGQVEAWGFDGASWSLLGENPLPVVQDTPEPPAEGVPPPVVEAANALLVWHADGEDRVLLLTARLELPSTSPAGWKVCCLSIFEVSAQDGDVTLRQLPLDAGAGQEIRVLDADADGTDELVVAETTSDGQTSRLEVLRRTGTGFASTVVRAESPLGYVSWVGDTDGLAGDELHLGPTPEGDFQRVAWIDGQIRVEQAHLDFGDRPGAGGWIAGIAGGRLVTQTEAGVRVLRWPSGDVPQTVAELPAAEFPSIYVIGTDADALILRQDSFRSFAEGPLTTAVYDLDLRRLGEVQASAAAARLWSAANVTTTTGANFYPFIGPVWGPTGDGRPAFIAAGAMIQPGGADGYEVRATASLPGLQPVGTVGPEGRWMALIGGYVQAPNVAYLYPGGSAFGRISLVRMDDVFRPDGDDARAAVELRNAVEPGGAVDGVRPLLAAPDGFSVMVDLPAGSYVINSEGPFDRAHEVADEPIVVEFAPRRNAPQDENQPLEVSLLLITPDGRASMVSWSGTYLREPPELSADGETDSTALSATLIGRTSDGASVRVDGRLIATDAAGRFVTSVDAPIWPSQVLVVARDPFGHETVMRVEVVGVLDYRDFPWAAVVVAATIAVGAALFVRTPRRRSADSPARSGDGRLEELELEDLEELGRAGIRRR